MKRGFLQRNRKPNRSASPPRLVRIETITLASSGSAERPQPADRRRVAWDGKAYLWEQFEEWYGLAAVRCWSEALPASANATRG